MQIDNEFLVHAPLDRVWNYMLDMERVAPCAPGAELTDVVDERTWRGKIKVKLGPVAMSFAGTVRLDERDDAGHRAVLKAEGREQRGRGAASALVTSWLEPVDEGTKVSISTQLTISGAAAQYGRGMIGDVSKRLTGEFAACLQHRMTAEATEVASGRVDQEPSAAGTSLPGSAPPALAGPATASPSPAPAKPVRGIRLAIWALWRALVRVVRRLFGRTTV